MQRAEQGKGSVSRIRIEYGQGETIVHLPMHRTPGHILRTVALAVMMALGGGFAYVLSLGSPRNPAFYQIWLSLWTVAMVGLVLYLAFVVFGADRLIIRRDGVSRVRSVLGLPYRQRFTPQEALSFKFVRRDQSIRYKQGKTHVPTSALVLSNRDRYVSIARRISPHEAGVIMEAIRERFRPAP